MSTKTEPSSSQRPRTVHVEHCMGTVFSIDIRDSGQWDDAIADTVAWLHQVDSLFSTYRTGSQISRLRGGELSLAAADPLVAEVLDLCNEVRTETHGHFSPTYDGALDPTGLVKGWAIDRASTLLHQHGSDNHMVNGGGDVQTCGESAPGRPWRIGIADPLDRTRLLTVVDGRGTAVASSGVTERGRHIIDPVTRAAPDELVGVTVVGPRLTRVDGYATAAFVMGPHALSWVEGLPGYEALLVGVDGVTHASSGWPGPLTAP